MKMTRRSMLGYTAGVAAGALASNFLPPNLRRALAQQPKPGSLRDIKHVVLLMQENRSFDHYFGTMAGVRGFDDPQAMSLDHGKSVFYQPDVENPDGYMLPFRLDTRLTGAQKIPSTDHGWQTQHAAWNGGKMDQWVTAHRKADGKNGPFTMGHYTRADIPFHFALAEAFTICDGYHCSVLGPTFPNRTYWMTGMIDPDGKAGGPMISNDVPKDGLGWKTYAERLEEAGISWKVYQEKDNYGCNVLEYFKAFRQAPKDSPLAIKGTTRGPVGQFEYDAMNDKLPAVSWIIPTSFQSEHPDFMPAEGAAFISAKLDAIAANPEVWAKTAFILNYDENDGIFDHVAPPSPPPGTPDEFVNGTAIGAGFRVPCMVVSPWTAGGWVCSQPFDHTSVVQFLETFTGIRETNISDWRRKTFGNLASVFRFGAEAAAPAPLPDTSSLLNLARYESAFLPPPPLPGSNQSMPTQEKGVRKRIPVA
jgi:phospholipase C